MPDFLTQVSAFTVFLCIAALGFLFLLVSLVFGEVFEHLGDGAFEHDFDHSGPSFFSVRILSVFVTAFGGFGAVGTHYGLPVPGASALGFGSGLLFASIIFAFARFLFSQQATTEVRSSDIVGQTAWIVVSIPKGGVGQVRCRVGEELIDKMARSADGSPIPENAIVKVQDVVGEFVIVRPE